MLNARQLNLLAELLTKYPKQLRIVLALRYDFEPQLRDAVEETHWQEAWQEGRFFVTPMDREELQQAIEEPAAQRTLFFGSPKLVNQLIDEVIDTPGALPLLSFTLSELYLKYLQAEENRERDDRTITEADYERLGGVARSLTQTADNTYKEVKKKENLKESTIRNVMLRMVAISSGELARRRVPMKELEYPKSINKKVKIIIDRFVEARLLVKGLDTEGREYVEPVHDALVTGWTKIKYWLDEKQETIEKESGSNPIKKWLNAGLDKVPLPLRIKENGSKRKSDRPLAENPLKIDLPLQREVTTAANRWSGKDKSFLWNADPRLDLLKQLLNSDDNWFNKVEAEFMQHSLSLREKNRRIRMGLVFTAFSIVSGFAFIQWQQSQEAQSINLATSSQTIFASDRQLEALIEGIKAGKTLKRVIFPDPDATHQVVTALNQLVYDSTEYNRLKGEEVFYRISFSPNGKMLVLVNNNSIQLWSLDGKKLKTLNSTISNINNRHSISFSPDGKIVASGGEDGIIQLLELESNEVKTFTTNLSSVDSTSFSSNGKILAVGSKKDNIIQLWNLESNKVKTFTTNLSSVNSIRFSPDGKILALVNKKGILQLWSRDGKKLTIPSNFSDERSFKEISFSPDGKMLALSSTGIIQLYNTQTGEKIGGELEGDSSWVGNVSFSSDGKMLASGGYDGIIKVWDTATGKELWKIQGSLGMTGASILDISFSPVGKILASVGGSVGGEESIKLWNLDSKNKPRLLKGQFSRIDSVSFSPNGKMLALAGDDNFIELWNLDGENKPRMLKGQLSRINNVSFSPNGKMLALAGEKNSNDNFIELWNLDSEEQPRILQGHASGIRSISFSPNGKMLASGGNDGKVKLWSLDSNKEPKTLEGLSNLVNSVSFSPDGKMLASTSKNGTLILWTLEDNKKLWSKQMESGPGGQTLQVSFSTDGKILATVGEHNIIRLWNLEGNEIRTIRGQLSGIDKISFSPSGKMLASVERLGSIGNADDSIIKLVNLEGRELRRLKSQLLNINSISFSPDGKILSSAGEDGIVILWNLDLDDLLKRGCDRVWNYLKNNPNVTERDRTLCDGVPKFKQVASQSSTPLTPKDFHLHLQAIAENYYTRGNEQADSKYLENFPNIIAKSRTNAEKADHYVNKGVTHYRQRNYNLTIDSCTEAIELDPNNVHAYINRGIAHSTLSNHEKAIRDYNEAIEIDSENIDAYISRGIAYSGLGNHEQAINDYNRAIAIAPKNADTYYALGFTLSLQERSKQKAIQAYQKAAELYREQGKTDYSQSAHKQIKKLE
ncbi:MAG: tetratricopeptide repeat protein [Xenococcaceae cyanobacterium]